MTLTLASLFSGVGGMDLGLERAGMTVRWQVENDPYCRRVLAKHWPDIPRYGDIRNVDYRNHSAVEVLCGGFPCQDISNAHTNGARASLAGAKSGLWREFVRAIVAVAPQWVIVENVAAWRRWVPDVRADLARLGYASVPLQLSAGSIGAPHKRPRVFVVAHADGESEPLRAIHAEVARLRPVPRVDGDWREPPPGGFRMAHGAAGRMDRLRTAGNAVVPQVAQWIGRRIVEAAA